MEEYETLHPDYIKGFNEGYTLQQHLPDLSEKLVQNVGDSVRSTGFKDGRQEFLMEKKREKYPAWRKMDWVDKSDDLSVKDKTKDLEKDIDDPEPEH